MPFIPIDQARDSRGRSDSLSDFHTDERMLDPENRRATVQHKNVIAECHAPSTRTNPSRNCLD